jgi:hypothetical protein
MALPPLPRRWSRHRFVLIAVLAGSVLVRLGWALSRLAGQASLSGLPDQVEYLGLARNFLHAGMLCFFDPRFGQTAWAYRMPGYPVFVAACGGSLRVVRGVQAVLDASTVLAVYLLGRRILDGRACLIAGAGRPGGARHSGRSHLAGMQPGLPPPAIKEIRQSAAAPLWAAALVAVNPFLIYFGGLILSETLFTAMLAWGMYLLSDPHPSPPPEYQGRGQNRRMPMGRVSWWAGVLLLSGSVIVRPEAAFLAPLLVLAGWAMNCASPAAYKWGWVSVVVCIGVIFLMLLPWERRNSLILGRSVWLTTNGGITLYDGNHLGADGSSNQSFLTDMPQLTKMGEVERNAYLTARAEDFIERHPGEFIELAIRKLARTWSPMPLSKEFGSRGHVLAALAYFSPFDVLVLLGLISFRLRPSAKVFLMMPAIYLTAVHALTVGSLRYLVPAEAPMAIVAALVLSGIGEPGRPRPGADRGEDAPAL